MTLPFFYAGEVFSGVEYQVASHLIASGRMEEGLAVVAAARARYDGRYRNPFAEVEAGLWYGRALSSYALLQAFSGARYDAVERVLYLTPPHTDDFSCFIATADGYGHAGVRGGKAFLEVLSGKIEASRIETG